MENNWLYKTIERLEKQVWQDSPDDTHLVRRAKELRRTPLNEFSIEDMRFMIGQTIGLDYLIPMAVDQLTENILAEGDFYEGDLLEAVLGIPKEFWDRNKSLWSQMRDLLANQRQQIEGLKLDLSGYLDQVDI